jgi:hypothetical protein
MNTYNDAYNEGWDAAMARIETLIEGLRRRSESAAERAIDAKEGYVYALAALAVLSEELGRIEHEHVSAQRGSHDDD